ncbi:hypothetical protein OH687_24055 [Burkholderia anthina]|nr:hypothetical protein OH687_24055 [Burkholderia anthina]
MDGRAEDVGLQAYRQQAGRSKAAAHAAARVTERHRVYRRNALRS